MTEDRVVYSNGRFVPESEAKVSIFDSALMFGDMVFEMTRSFNKKQFRLGEHLQRLYAGVKMLRSRPNRMRWNAQCIKRSTKMNAAGLSQITTSIAL